MLRWQTLTGVGLGLVIAAVILALAGGPGPRRSIPSGPIISECDGHLREVVIHYEPSAKSIVSGVYRDLLSAFESDITVHVVCPTQTAFQELLSIVPNARCTFKLVIVRHAMTTWSRDRWVAFGPPSSGGSTTLWSPRTEAAEEIWPARAGDERIGEDLAVSLHPRLYARRSELYFDGGDFLADGENVFVVPRVLQRNIQHTVRNQDEFLIVLGRELKRRVILLRQAPDHHAGMFMMSVGNRTMLVGDPGLAVQCLSGERDTVFAMLPGGSDLRPETQARFDAVAAQCVEAGYKVIRIPVLPAPDGRTFLTYVNVLMDQQGPRRIVYLPFYLGAEALNTAARSIWEQLGYEVRPVDCTSAYQHFGCLHCLVNVLTRS